MSVQDVIKKSILESGAFDGLSIINIALGLITAMLIGAVIYFTYQKFYTGVIYSRSFAVTLVGMTILTAVITLAISTNIVISLGMVGALSIVRFRTAVKDPLDLLYLFWAITSGIASGANMYLLVIVAALVMVGIIVLFNKHQLKGRIYIAVIHYITDEAGDNIIRTFGKMKYFIKSKTVRKDIVEMAVEVYCRNNDTFFIEKIRDIEGVEDVTLIQYNGEYHG
ncbi:MAG: DUF4956 domain-containing protein [Clostridia bacterium]|nr:DUF4956 domain-containing protein [Clostridia bacterium]MBO7288504.1 DUF4956 domain-containing protein [Clostridia bacterium]